MKKRKKHGLTTKRAGSRKHKLPTSVKIGGAKIAVHYQVLPEAEEAYGLYRQTNNAAWIAVDSRLTWHRRLATFFHELFHAIDDVGGLGLKHRQIDGLGELTAQALERYFR